MDNSLPALKEGAQVDPKKKSVQGCIPKKRRASNIIESTMPKLVKMARVAAVPNRNKVIRST